MIVSLWWCMDVCACVIVLYLIFVFLFVMIVLLHFMRNKLNIIDLFCHDGLEISDDSLVISDAVFHVILLNRLALPDTHDRCGAYGYRCSVVCVSVGHKPQALQRRLNLSWCRLVLSIEISVHVCVSASVSQKSDVQISRNSMSILLNPLLVTFWWMIYVMYFRFVDDVISVQSARQRRRSYGQLRQHLKTHLFRT